MNIYEHKIRVERTKKRLQLLNIFLRKILSTEILLNKIFLFLLNVSVPEFSRIFVRHVFLQLLYYLTASIYCELAT